MDLKTGDRVWIRKMELEGEVIPFVPADKYFDRGIFVRVKFQQSEGPRKSRRCSNIFYKSDLTLLSPSLF